MGESPVVLQDSLRWLALNALTTPGLFSNADSRAAAARRRGRSAARALREAYIRGERPLRSHEAQICPHAVSEVLVQWLESLPRPLAADGLERAAEMLDDEDATWRAGEGSAAPSTPSTPSTSSPPASPTAASPSPSSSPAPRVRALRRLLRALPAPVLEALYPLVEVLHHAWLNAPDRDATLADISDRFAKLLVGGAGFRAVPRWAPWEGARPEDALALAVCEYRASFTVPSDAGRYQKDKAREMARKEKEREKERERERERAAMAAVAAGSPAGPLGRPDALASASLDALSPSPMSPLSPLSPLSPAAAAAGQGFALGPVHLRLGAPGVAGSMSPSPFGVAWPATAEDDGRDGRAAFAGPFDVPDVAGLVASPSPFFLPLSPVHLHAGSPSSVAAISVHRSLSRSFTHAPAHREPELEEAVSALLSATASMALLGPEEGGGLQGDRAGTPADRAEDEAEPADASGAPQAASSADDRASSRASSGDSTSLSRSGSANFGCSPAFTTPSLGSSPALANAGQLSLAEEDGGDDGQLSLADALARVVAHGSSRLREGGVHA